MFECLLLNDNAFWENLIVYSDNKCLHFFDEKIFL